ncbi:Zn-dependent protease with chaperone function [Silvibacterium bohemicum]|uniref:Zn-dependent protease with chaperone function n=1 Tax=Silvibacterium bohemicum TaxID=1577686 RepID=A0A841JVV2_9BACT|nr:M48 family metallopeptidase [Silvibacterium bohemicum]MBB6145512.1 Zn-dependent protease with chaperone function [Silvibacterium bohemicum]
MLLCFAAARDAVYMLPPDKLARAIHLSHARTLAHFGGTAWTALILWMLVRMRLGEFIRNWAARFSKRAWVQGLLSAPIWLLILTALDLPASLFMEHVYRAYGISVESWGLWLSDFAKSSVLTLIVGTLAFSALYALMRWSKRRWWLWFWILAIPCEAVAVFVVPIMIDPLFDHFSPLMKSDPALVDQLERVAARGHLNISPDRMFVMDASRKVTAPNAYVTGFGASKRIVVWDTTIQEVPADEILAIYGHEQGHYVLHHIYLGMLFSFAVMLVFFWIAYRMLLWMVHRFGAGWHITSPEDWASLGLILLLVTVLGFLAEPVGNAFSRWEEHSADVYGQEVIHGLVADPQAVCARSFQRLGELWLDSPDPNPLLVFWSYNHPSVSDRVRFAAGYDPWAPGQHPKYVAR